MGFYKEQQIANQEVETMIREGYAIYHQLKVPHLDEFEELEPNHQLYYLLSLASRISNQELVGDY